MKNEGKRMALGFALAPFAALFVLLARLTIQRESPPIPLLLIALTLMYVVEVVLVLPLCVLFKSNGIRNLSPYLAIGAAASLIPIIFSFPHPTLNLASIAWQIAMGWSGALTFWWIAIRETGYREGVDNA
jgi:hypothetical protein